MHLVYETVYTVYSLQTGARQTVTPVTGVVAHTCTRARWQLSTHPDHATSSFTLAVPGQNGALSILHPATVLPGGDDSGSSRLSPVHVI